MRPSELRRHVLNDHQRLRAQLDRIEVLTRPWSSDLSESGESARALRLREEGIRLIRDLERHMGWEDRHLVPAIVDADAWGPERARRLQEEHAEQRALLNAELEGLLDLRRPTMLVGIALRELVDMLRADMAEEERFFLDPDVLRDDVVGINVAAG